jgi:hypothetical protein
VLNTCKQGIDPVSVKAFEQVVAQGVARLKAWGVDVPPHKAKAAGADIMEIAYHFAYELGQDVRAMHTEFAAEATLRDRVGNAFNVIEGKLAGQPAVLQGIRSIQLVAGFDTERTGLHAAPLLDFRLDG